MYGGRVVEQGTLDELFYDPQHPYTWGLLGSITAARPRPLRAAAGDPGHAAVAARTAGGLPLPAALPVRVRQVQPGPGLESRAPDASAHLDRCWLTVEDKRERREVDGRIGLAIEGTVTS